ncbi:MAG TPA: prolyl oligopeptidase family serine peptidase [Planctomycetota bacterium]|nr:prolyl oligopeptidase family serine peptidase [Planctomycetota bacterium]
MRPWGLVLLLASSCASPREPEPTGWDRVVREALALQPAIPAGDAAILDGLEARARDRLTALHHPGSRASLDEAVPEIRRRLRASLGLDDLPTPEPRNRRSVGVLPRDGYQVEKLVFESLPGVDVPAHLYLPALPAGKRPAVLFVPGHWYSDSKTKADFQAFAITMARRGFVVLTYDPFGQGERGISQRDHRRTELLAAGIAQEAIVAFESLCAFQVLLDRPEVDPSRIGMTGASGGGFNSWIVPALEPRIAATVPVVGTSDFLEQLRAVRHADWFTAKEHCHYIPGLFRYANNHELLACVAPRPVLVVSAHHDIGFPVPGQRDVVTYGELLYLSLGAEGRVGYFEDVKEGHGYQKRKREAAYGWFLKWLKNEGDGAPVEEAPLEIPAWDLPELRCFPPGENHSAGPGLVALAKRVSTRASRENRDEDDWLSRVLGIEAATTGTGMDLIGEESRLSFRPLMRAATPGPKRVSWRMSDGVVVPAILMRPGATVRGVLVGVADEGKESLLGHPAVRLAYEGGWAVLLADLRGMGELSVTKPGWVYAMSLLLGENFVGRQALDLQAGILALGAEPWLRDKPVGILARGAYASFAGLYASSLHPTVAWLAAEHGFSSVRAFLDRPRSEPASFTLATPGRERDVVLDREIPHALIPFGILRHERELSGLLENRRRVVWADAVDGDFEPAPGPDSVMPFVRARLEEVR